MSLTLYQSDLSPYATRVRIFAAAKGLAYERKLPPGGALKSAEYLAINPIGKLPCLETDGISLPESEVICEYLDDAYPTPSLRPADPKARAKARLIARLVDLYVAPPFGKLLRQMDPKTRDKALCDEYLAEIETGLGYVAHYLEGPNYAVGGKLSIADCTLAPFLFFFGGMVGSAFGRPDLVKGKLKTYHEAISKDAIVAKAFEEMQVALAERMKQAAG